MVDATDGDPERVGECRDELAALLLEEARSLSAAAILVRGIANACTASDGSKLARFQEQKRRSWGYDRGRGP